MAGLRVGVELIATSDAITATMATLPWMAPERIALDEGRCLVILSTSFNEAGAACAYAERRVRKSATGMGLAVAIVSSEAFPPALDAPWSSPGRLSDWHLG